MAVGENGRPVRTTGLVKPGPGTVGKHIHRGTPESTTGGPGCTDAPGANLEGSAGGGSPYGAGGDGS